MITAPLRPKPHSHTINLLPFTLLCSPNKNLPPFRLPTSDGTIADDILCSFLQKLITRSPDTRSITFDGFFFIVRAPLLRPSFSTLKGFTTYMTNDLKDAGPIAKLLRTPSKNNLAVSPNLNVWDGEEIFGRHINTLIVWLDERAIVVTEIQYWRFFIVIVLKDKNQDLTAVPCSFAGLPCYYLFERDMQIPVINSISSTEDGVCGVCSKCPSVRTWLRARSAGGWKWVQARWMWKDLGKQDEADTAPMAGWHLCVSRKGLGELLGG